MCQILWLQTPSHAVHHHVVHGRGIPPALTLGHSCLHLAHLAIFLHCVHIVCLPLQQEKDR